jgi:gas vesicle protein
VKVGIKGKGAEIKWVDIQELPVTKELVKFKKETNETISKLESALGELRTDIKNTAETLKSRIRDLEHYVALKEGGNNEEDII